VPASSTPSLPNDPELVELRELISRCARGHSVARHDQLAWVYTCVSVQPTTPAPVAVPVVELIAQGARRFDTVLVESGEHYVAVPASSPTSAVERASERKPFLALGIVLRPEVIASLGLDAERIELDEPSAPRTTSRELIDAALRLLRIWDRDADLRVIAPMLEREIVWRLLAGPDGARVRAIALAATPVLRVANAAAWLRDRYAQKPRIDQLSRKLGMSVASFHRHFQRLHAITPLELVKAERLRVARARLLGGESDLEGIARSIGYRSTSQFAREYRQFFGSTPGRDAARSGSRGRHRPQCDDLD